ncbi:hypothetical protein [Aliidongia dinghuensis]|nr:hypothetical protein [Aliidongia dinghuensis]
MNTANASSSAQEIARFQKRLTIIDRPDPQQKGTRPKIESDIGEANIAAI